MDESAFPSLGTWSEMARLVILVRDGVIYPAAQAASPAAADLEPLPGSLEAIARLNHWGFKVAVLVPRAGPANSTTLDILNATNARLHQLLSRVGGHVDGIFICSDEAAEPDCGTQLYPVIAERFSQPLGDAPVIAAAPQDLAAAARLGARAMLVGSKAHPERETTVNGDYPCYDDLGHAVEYLLTQQP